MRANLRPEETGGDRRRPAETAGDRGMRGARQAPLNQSQAMGAIMTAPSTIEAIDSP